ncbi:MAG: M28 family peptidase [Spirochaetales bacterium]|nr:M28 family peptidase [Spirochaetales bacterium]
MELDWHAIDRWLIGEAWAGSRINEHLAELCDRIGPRWSSSEAEWEVIRYIHDQLRAAGLDQVATDEYELDTWSWKKAEARVVEDNQPIDLLPFNRCPSCEVQSVIIDAGYGTPRELETVRADLPGAVAVMAMGYEPFTQPVPLPVRLKLLKEARAAAAIVVDVKSGRRIEYHTATDWRDAGLDEHPLPTLATSRESGTLLRKLARAGKTLSLKVESRFFTAPSANVTGMLAGTRWPGEHLLLGGHHDTVYGSPGGNDNASGAIAVLETARVLAALHKETGIGPGRALRFATYSAEEQKLQGSSAYVDRHYKEGIPPRLAINLDELSTGRMKGIVLGFPHLRELVQRQLDTMKDGLQCQVMSQLDPSSDHFPFLRAGLDAAFLWRWRFDRRHPDAEFHHEHGDTSDKVNVRELKDYVGQLARILLRLSHVPPEEWPANTITPGQVRARLETERGAVVRVF